MTAGEIMTEFQMERVVTSSCVNLSVPDYGCTILVLAGNGHATFTTDENKKKRIGIKRGDIFYQTCRSRVEVECEANQDEHVVLFRSSTKGSF